MDKHYPGNIKFSYKDANSKKIKTIAIAAGLEDNSYYDAVTFIKSKDMGLSIEELTPKLRYDYEIKESLFGLIITSIKEGKLANKIGLEEGDIITKINNKPSKKLSDGLIEIANTLKIKNSVKLEINRNGKILTFQLK